MSDLLSAHLYIVHYRAGSRGDFLAGWLASLPGSLDDDWSIDCSTGKSFTSASYFKLFPQYQGQTLENFVKCWGCFLDSNKARFKAAVTHNDHIVGLMSSWARERCTIVSIQTDLESLRRIAWENFVKQYLTVQQQNGQTKYLIDLCLVENHSDDSRRYYAEEKFRQGIPKWMREWSPCQSADIVFHYKDIFRRGGSQIIADGLDLKLEHEYHNLWNLSLSAAESPPQIQRWGRIFKFCEFATND